MKYKTNTYRFITVEGEPCVEIDLNHDLCTLIDVVDFDRVIKYTWGCIKPPVYKRDKTWYSKNGENIYAVSGNICQEETGNRRLHRFILDYTGDLFIDHRNNNPLDNRRNNLRICDYYGNNRNKKSKYNLISKTPTKYKGVIITIKASITVDGNVITLGTFTTEKEAAIAYNEAALKYFGEFAYLNEIED